VSWRGHRVHVTETGQGDPLLLVPGIGNSTNMWTPFIEQFTTRRVIRLDAPGTGLSSTPVFPVSVPALADLLAAVLDDREAPWADVVGFSYGGAVAQQFAFNHPSRVRRLVLAATFCGVGAVPGSLEALAAITTPLRYYSPTYFERTAAATCGGVAGRCSETRSRMMAARREQPPSPYGYALQILGITGWSSWPFLDLIPHETLVISGDDDPLVPVANAMMLASRIPRATLEIVADGGHLLLWDDAKNLGNRIGRFVNAPITH
jgi:pimeloyl-ACP methyl ester carboxylesterase